MFWFLRGEEDPNQTENIFEMDRTDIPEFLPMASPLIISSTGTRTHRTVIPQIFITSSVYRPPTGPPTEKAEEVTINKWVSISVAYKEFYWSASNYHTTSLATYTQHIQLWICHHHILNVICLCKTKCLCRPISYSLIVEVGWQDHL